MPEGRNGAVLACPLVVDIEFVQQALANAGPAAFGVAADMDKRDRLAMTTLSGRRAVAEETGIDAGAVQGRTACATGILETLDEGGAVAPGRDADCNSGDVLARAQQTFEIVVPLVVMSCGARRMNHHVAIRGENLLDAVGGYDANRLASPTIFQLYRRGFSDIPNMLPRQPPSITRTLPGYSYACRAGAGYCARRIR